MKVLFNADDFGLTKGVTDGIIKSHTDGVVDSTTLLMNGFHVDYAVKQAKIHPSLKIGIHLVLSWGKPLSGNVPGLIDENGYFKYGNAFASMQPPDMKEVEREWEAQMKAFKQTGLELHHIDSHHHIHGWGALQEVVVQLARKYKVPVRYVESLRDYPKLLLTEKVWTTFYGEGVKTPIFESLKSLHVASVEVMTHPAFVDEMLYEVSSYTDNRAIELAILCELEKPDWAQSFF